MWPFLEFFGWYLPTYNAVLAAGVLLGFGVLLLAIRRKRLNLAFLADHTIVILLIAVFTARLAEIIVRGYPLGQFFYFWEDTGFDFFAGVAAAGVVLFVACRRASESVLRWFDALLLALTAVVLFHHLGMFASGLAYGTPTTLPWGVLFDNPESAVLTNLPVHPTQLYAAVLTLVVFLVAAVFYKASVAAGRTAAFILIMLFGGSFVLEFLRDDSAPMWLGLRVSQYGECVFAAAGVLLAIREYRHAHARRHLDGALPPPLS